MDAFSLSPEQFLEWQVYDAMTGNISGRRRDIQFALLTQSMGGTSSTSVEDWIPSFNNQNEQSAELEQKAWFASRMTT